MRLLKVISLFLVIQLCSFALYQTINGAEKPAYKPAGPRIPEITTTEQAAPLSSDLSHVRFAAKTLSKKYRLMSKNEKQGLTDVLEKLPESHVESLKSLILDLDPKAHRGLGGGNIIILRGVDMDAEERVGVLVHEMGHVTDLGSLVESEKTVQSEFNDGKKPVYEGDPSLDFYRISWENDKTRDKKAGNLDFVSGYAMTDPFEDFAESYVYYVLHNKDFKSKTQTSSALLKKYQFMKNEVFGGIEFDTGEYLTDGLKRRPWDITVMAYDLENFLNS